MTPEQKFAYANVTVIIALVVCAVWVAAAACIFAIGIHDYTEDSSCQWLSDENHALFESIIGGVTLGVSIIAGVVVLYRWNAIRNK
jgi:hypothetical protein